MAYTHNPGFGSLLTNFDKKHDKAPDMTGVLKLERDYQAGEEVKISAWNKPNPKGMIITLKENNYKGGEQQQYPKEVNRDAGDVPF